jgi:hypothetical protein
MTPVSFRSGGAPEARSTRRNPLLKPAERSIVRGFGAVVRRSAAPAARNDTASIALTIGAACRSAARHDGIVHCYFGMKTFEARTIIVEVMTTE